MSKILDANTSNNIQQAIQEAIEQARAACEAKGNESGDCAVAWEIVEELQAEKCHKYVPRKPKSSFEQYCDQNPDAVECLIYDV